MYKVNIDLPGCTSEANRLRAENALRDIIYNLSLDTVELFAKASKTSKGRGLITQGAVFIKGKV